MVKAKESCFTVRLFFYDSSRVLVRYSYFVHTLKPKSMQELYVAIVDDDEDDVQLLKECFEKYNSIEVRSFSTSQAFLDTPMNGSLPCLLVIDLNLPDIRGVDLIDQIKANPTLADVPIVVYTTSYSRSEQVNCEELKIRLLKKPDTVLEWNKIALIMAQHCDESL